MNYLAVLVSGNGSNLQAIIDACEAGVLPETRVSVVVSNHRDAYALERARKHGIPTIYHPFLPYRKAGRSRAGVRRRPGAQAQRLPGRPGRAGRLDAHPEHDLPAGTIPARAQHPSRAAGHFPGDARHRARLRGLSTRARSPIPG